MSCMSWSQVACPAGMGDLSKERICCRQIGILVERLRESAIRGPAGALDFKPRCEGRICLPRHGGGDDLEQRRAVFKPQTFVVGEGQPERGLERSDLRSDIQAAD